MASQRHNLRVIVMQTLFAWEFRGGDAEAILNYNLVNAGALNSEIGFAGTLLKKVLLHRNEIKEKIAHYAPEWPFEKIAPVDRAILELGLAELLFDPEIPALVAINEAIELAKDYGSENASKFVNGVLSSVYDDQKDKTNPA